MRTLPSFVAATALMVGAAFAQTTAPATTPGANGTMTAPSAAAPANDGTNGAAPANQGDANATSNNAVNPPGNANSSVNASGTIKTMPMSQLQKGANSFTEGQARSRIESAGFTNITDLKTDDQGIWRGKATKDGKSVNVGFDFKGDLAAE